MRRKGSPSWNAQTPYRGVASTTIVFVPSSMVAISVAREPGDPLPHNCNKTHRTFRRIHHLHDSITIVVSSSTTIISTYTVSIASLPLPLLLWWVPYTGAWSSLITPTNLISVAIFRLLFHHHYIHLYCIHRILTTAIDAVANPLYGCLIKSNHVNNLSVTIKISRCGS